MIIAIYYYSHNHNYNYLYCTSLYAKVTRNYVFGGNYDILLYIRRTVILHCAVYTEISQYEVRNVNFSFTSTPPKNMVLILKRAIAYYTHYSLLLSHYFSPIFRCIKTYLILIIRTGN